jgi:hypothetical protein
MKNSSDPFSDPHGSFLRPRFLGQELWVSSMKHLGVAANFVATNLLLVMSLGCSGENPVTTLQRRIVVENPRKVGEHYFAAESADGKGIGVSSEKTGSFQTEVWDYPVSIAILVRLRTGEVIVPRYKIRVPRFDTFENIYYIEKDAPPELLVRQCAQTYDFPYSPDYSAYIMILQGFAENTGKRYFEVAVDQIHDSSCDVCVPDLMQLPVVESRKDGNELLRALSQATLEYKQLHRDD